MITKIEILTCPVMNQKYLCKNSFRDAWTDEILFIKDEFYEMDFYIQNPGDQEITGVSIKCEKEKYTHISQTVAVAFYYDYVPKIRQHRNDLNRLSEYFYTPQELRKMKLKEINEKM